MSTFKTFAALAAHIEREENKAAVEAAERLRNGEHVTIKTPHGTGLRTATPTRITN
jgi:hypothetical protein